jgi:hypothetical protein
MKRLKTFTSWFIKKSWFFSVSLFFGLLISGNIASQKDLFRILILCLLVWLLDFLFLKKGIGILLNNVLNLYKSFIRDLNREK